MFTNSGLSWLDQKQVAYVSLAIKRSYIRQLHTMRCETYRLNINLASDTINFISQHEGSSWHCTIALRVVVELRYEKIP